MTVEPLTRIFQPFNREAVPHLLVISGENVGQPFCTFMSLVHQPLGPGPHCSNKKPGGAEECNRKNDPEDGAVEYRITEYHKPSTITSLVINGKPNSYSYLKEEIDATISTSGECVAQNTITVGTCSSGARLVGRSEMARASRRVRTKMRGSTRVPIDSE